MSNTITPIVETLYAMNDVVSAEKADAILAVNRNAAADGAAKNQAVNVPIAPAATMEDVTPGANPADSGDNTFSTVSMTITKEKVVPVRWNGNEQLYVGGKVSAVFADQSKQAFRALRNAVSADIMLEARLSASRAYGTSGTAPFGTKDDFSDFAQMGYILDQNGAPSADRNLILTNEAVANMKGKQPALWKVNEAGDGGVGLRRGIVSDVLGFNLFTDGNQAIHTAGTLSAGTVTASAGATSLTLSGGTGSILAGDVVTIGSHKYVVVSATGTAPTTAFVIAAPGLQAAASNATVTINASFKASVALTPNAVQLLARTPAMPMGGDRATDVINIVDEQSGLVFQVAVYPEYRRTKYEFGLAWGVDGIKSEHIALLLG